MSENPQEARLAELSEAGVLARLLEAAGPAAAVRAGDVGPGDDAAVLTLPSHRLVISTDTLTEDHDFLRATTTAHWLGRKAAVQNLADIAAMGCRPLAVLSALSLPGQTPAEVAAGITGGLAAVCAEHDVRLIGGDLGASEAISLTVTALGALPPQRRPVLRSGARPGDQVLLAAPHLGRAAAGLALVLGERVRHLPGSIADAAQHADALPSGREAGLVLDLPETVLEDGARALAWQGTPAPDLTRGWEDADALTALIDISDGLVRDAGRIALDSRTMIDLNGAVIDALAAAHRPLADALGADPRSWVLHGGEEHAMLATAAPEQAESLGPAWRRIGTVRAAQHEGPIAARVLLDGAPISGEGWDHFAADVG